MKDSRHAAQAGLTLIEVIVAIAVLGFSLPAIMRLVAAADTMRGRSNQIAGATLLVRNEVERLRRIALLQEPLNDTSYTQTRDGLELRVERRVLGDDGFGGYGYFDPFETELKTTEIYIGVYTGEERLISYRLLQGYER